MLPSTTAVIGGYVYEIINLTTSKHSVINVEGQTSKNTPTPLFAVENIFF